MKLFISNFDVGDFNDKFFLHHAENLNCQTSYFYRRVKWDEKGQKLPA